MLSELVAIIRKEWKEVLLQRGSVRGGLMNLAIFVVLIGIVLPLQIGPEWLTSPLGPLVWSWLPIMLTAAMITDAFAGERERHTLETLLASRLSDRVILFGKLFASVLYSWSLTIVNLLVGAVVVNLAHPEGGLRFYVLGSFLGTLSLSLLAAFLMGSVGVLVSLNAPNVRSAYQKLTIAFLGIWMVPNFLPLLLPQSVKTAISQGLGGLNLWGLIAGVVVVLMVIDAIVLNIVMGRFKRNRLILD